MKYAPHKLSNKGGYRIPKPLRKSTSRLLDYLFEQYGGPTRVAEDLDTHPQALCRWRLKGEVPMNWVGPLSRLLKCWKEALNYNGMLNLNGPKLTWGEVIDRHVSREKIEYVRNGQLPKETLDGK